MPHRAYFFGLFVLAGAVIAGCNRSADKEVAALRADLEAANAKIKELNAEVARNANNQPAKIKSRLVVVRGLRPKWEYPIFEGRNIIGRADQQPVEIDLQPQEPEDRVWSSRQHAAITCTAGVMVIEDLNSSNGTYVNRTRVPPGEKRALAKDDMIQIGEVQIRVLE
jgi:hypothetical protein